MAATGPAYTVLDVQRLSDGRVRVLVRKRGGRLIRLHVPMWVADPANIDRMIEQIIETWPGIPDPELVEG